MDELLEFTRFEHLGHDVRATYELAFDEQLGNGGPIAVALDPLANVRLFKDIDGLERFEIHATGL